MALTGIQILRWPSDRLQRIGPGLGQRDRHTYRPGTQIVRANLVQWWRSRADSFFLSLSLVSLPLSLSLSLSFVAPSLESAEASERETAAKALRNRDYELRIRNVAPMVRAPCGVHNLSPISVSFSLALALSLPTSNLAPS